MLYNWSELKVKVEVIFFPLTRQSQQLLAIRWLLCELMYAEEDG